MIELVYARVADELQSAAPCFVGDPPENIPVPYLFVWGPLPVENPETLADALDYLDEEIHVQVVAKQVPDVLILAGAAKRTLNGWSPTVAGWRMFPLEITGSTNVQTARQIPNEESNTYPAWLTLHVRVQATKTKGDA